MTVNLLDGRRRNFRPHDRSTSHYLSSLLRYAFRERRLDAHKLAVIASSQYFDASYYLEHNNDVADAGVDPVVHFVDHGAREGRNPSSRFDVALYMESHPELASSGGNPLFHYLSVNNRTTPPPAPHRPPSPRKASAPKGPASPKSSSANTEAPEPRHNLASVTNYLKSLDNKALIAAMQRIDATVLVPRTKDQFKARAWEDLSKLSAVFLNTSPERQRILLTIGRGSLYAGDAENGSNILSFAARLFPGNVDAQLYSGIAQLRTGHVDPAISCLRQALRLDSSNLTIKRELATALRRALKLRKTEAERRTISQEAVSLLMDVFRAQPNPAAAMAAARLFYELKRYDECASTLERVIEVAPPFVEHMALRSRALIGLNRVNEALALSDQILALAPGHLAANFQKRTLRFLSGGESSEPKTFGEITISFTSAGPSGESDGTAGAVDERIEEALSKAPFTWLRISSGASGRNAAVAATPELEAAANPRCGFFASGDKRFWRRDAVLDLVRSGLVSGSLSRLKDFEAIYSSTPRHVPGSATAIVMSRNGSFKFGGGEHFLESMAEHYRDLGYRPIILGTRPELVGQSGEANGFRFSFVDESPDALRRFFMENDAHLVHAISGMGFKVAEALNYTNVPFIYGIHYWREALGHHDEDERFFDEAGTPIPRPEFHYILSRASTVYTNSVYTRDVIEKAFGVRCPIVFSVPKEQSQLS